MELSAFLSFLPSFASVLERISVFLPSTAAIATIAAVAGYYAKHTLWKYGENLTSVEWLKENQRTVTLKYGFPMIYIWAPTTEELIFRAPLIIGFSALTSFAWYGIVISSALFAAIHWSGNKLNILDLNERDSNGNPTPDDIKEALDGLARERRNHVLIRRVAQVFLTFWLGILAGYFGILYQSMWVAVGIHVAWNLFMPLFFVGIILVIEMCRYFFGRLKIEIIETRVRNKELNQRLKENILRKNS